MIVSNTTPISNLLHIDKIFLKAPWFVDKLQRGLAQRWHRKDYKHSAAGGVSVILILYPLKESG